MIVHSTPLLCVSLNKGDTATDAETDSQLQLLCSYGCNAGPGGLLGRYAPAALLRRADLVALQ
jgi:EAL domain-containing protein (putative c-di-GMP-specific phosphodiesterase class I)